MDIYVIKANGERELFSEAKVRESIKRAGINSQYEERILTNIRKRLYQNIPTHKIYEQITSVLGQVNPSGQIRYQLKQAIMALGPTGYPFELFIGYLLEDFGYETQVGLELAGVCVKHEVDVLARKDNRTFFVECKYHNQQGIRSDVKVALYVQARAEDLISKQKDNDSYGCWIFTNTKFSADAISYAECKNMRLTGWNYPEKNNNLQKMIEKNNLYPLTILNSLSATEKRQALEGGIVLASQLVNSPELLRALNIQGRMLEKLKNECSLINCN